ncbi:MAG: tRNA adenosine(34) deaminase TadA [Bacteriovoracaceae bacterium]|nr:tRNA adenosine(34) deaminase TadA [Bacteroidota bacterium]
MTLHERWMKQALHQAERAYEQNEIPVGAVIVHHNTIIAKGYNQVEMMHDPTAHAEMIALTAAAAHLEHKFLKECILYVTMEPCPMCAGAIVLSRIPTIVFGCYDPKMGASGSVMNVTENKRLNHQVHVIGGVLDAECGGLIKEFFEKMRKSKGGGK